MKLTIIVYGLPLLLISYSSLSAQTISARNSTLVSNDNTAQIDSLVRVFTGQTVEEQNKQKSDKVEADRLEREAGYSAGKWRIAHKKEQTALKLRADAAKEARKPWRIRP